MPVYNVPEFMRQEKVQRRSKPVIKKLTEVVGRRVLGYIEPGHAGAKAMRKLGL